MHVASLDRLRPYLGIEPSVSCCVYLRRLVDCNTLPKHRILACALGDYDGIIDFVSNSAQDVFATTTPEHYPLTSLIVLPLFLA